MTRIEIKRVEVPTPFTVGPVNIFIVKGDALVLVDTGPITRPGFEILKSALARIGARLRHVDAILLTHAHIDHFGMGSVLLDRANAVVCGHREDQALIADYPSAHIRSIKSAGEYSKRHGFPPELFRRIQSMYTSSLECARPLEASRPVADGDRLEFGNVQIRVFHTPGHTSGSVCYYEKKSRTLFSGDSVLEHGAPAAFGGHEPGTHQGLHYYLKGVARLKKLPVSQVCPGHSRSFKKLRVSIKQVEQWVDGEERKVLRALKRGPKTAYALTKEIHRDERVRDAWRAFSRTLGVLELLQHRRAVDVTPNGQEQLLFTRKT